MLKRSLISIPPSCSFAIQATHSNVYAIAKDLKSNTELVKVSAIIDNNTKNIAGELYIFGNLMGPDVSLMFDSFVAFTPIEILTMVTYRYREFYKEEKLGAPVVSALENLISELMVREKVVHMISCVHNSITITSNKDEDI